MNLAMSYPPIPSLPEPIWSQVSTLPIQGSESELVPMSLVPPPVMVYPAYAKLGIPGAVAECYVRPEVHRRLLQAARSLPDGLSLVILDAWRPWRVQQYLYDTLYEAIRAQHAGLSDERLLERTREFVSLPSSDPAAPSPHLTGGAVDVTLCDENGLQLEMGTAFDEAVPASHSDYYERHAPADDTQQHARDNRRLLHHAMSEAGFTNLPSEWWHFDYGDQLWAWYRGERAALFGPAELQGIEDRWRRPFENH